MNTTIKNIYKDHQVKSFIYPELDFETWLLNPKPVPK